MTGIPLVYNLRNLWVRKVSTLLTMAGIGLAVGVLLVVLMLVGGLQYALRSSGSPDNAILLRKSAQSETSSAIGRDTAAILKTLPEIAVGPDGNPLAATETVAAVNLLRRGQTNARSGSNVTVRGITPASLLLRKQVKLVEGRAPTPGSPEIMAGVNAARGFEGCQLGGTIKMVGLSWTVVGVFTAGGSSIESELWGDTDLVMKAFGREGGFSSITFALKDPKLDLTELQKRLDADPRLNVEVKAERDYYEGTSGGLKTLITILGGVLIVLFTFGAVMGAMVTMFAFVGARTKEIGTLRALGFPRRSILLCFLVESVLLALAGGVLACIPALFIQQLTFSTTNFSSFTDVTWSFRATPGIFAGGLIFAVLMGFFGGLIPAARAARLPIINALREA
ncbi:MAG TPA: ABC transporter permease [Candidatus Polarisedimenticolia bacterium]|nr:ABC transporter permease [Candidatus Polarisedimenticolia bacterium]